MKRTGLNICIGSDVDISSKAKVANYNSKGALVETGIDFTGSFNCV